jgi:serine/threonine protein phosphatase PrpC
VAGRWIALKKSAETLVGRDEAMEAGAEAKKPSAESSNGTTSDVQPGCDAALASDPGWPHNCLRWAFAMSYHKREDRILGHPCISPPPECTHAALHTLSVFAVLDGHNGASCVDFVHEHLLRYLWDFFDFELSQLSSSNTLDALASALNAAFVQLHSDFRSCLRLSGTTATILVLHRDGGVLANVGDSTAVLDDGSRVLQELTHDFRLNRSKDEAERLRMQGAHLERSRVDNVETGPLRVWPGGMVFARAIGDIDVPCINPRPHIQKLPQLSHEAFRSDGVRIVLATDGLWDEMPPLESAKIWRKHANTRTPGRLVKHALRRVGDYSDDISVVVVDVVESSDSPELTTSLRTSKVPGCTIGFVHDNPNASRCERPEEINAFMHNSSAEAHTDS